MPDALRDVQKAIDQQDSRLLALAMFDITKGIPTVRTGFYHERRLWDFKLNIPSARRSDMEHWAGIAADVLAFYNANGGTLIFGIHDSNFSFCGCTERLDTKLFNDKLRHFLGDRFYVIFSREFVQADQKYLGVAMIPPRKNEYLRFRRDGHKLSGELYFSKGDLAIREQDQTLILRGSEATKFLVEKGQSLLGSLFGVEKPGYRILAPDYARFIHREEYCEPVLAAVRSRRTFVTSLTGIGGVGKTALACWAVNEVYNSGDFDFICSVSAKDRELTSSGITAIKPMFTSYIELLNQILETLGFLDGAPEDIIQREALCKELITNESILLFVDNLETVDDTRIIRFLEQLPDGVRAIVTSRRSRVRVAAQPIEIGPFQEPEAVQFLESLALHKNRPFLLESMSESERIQIARACDRVPLVIEWFVGRCRTAQEASDFANTLSGQESHSEELLEFCFRNVYAQMPNNMRSCLKVIGMSGTPVPVEAIAAGSRLQIDKVMDSLEELRDFGLVESRYDDTYRDDCLFLLPVTRAFVNREIRRQGEEQSIRKALSRWYEAEDVADLSERELMREVRRGGRFPELTILELADQKRIAGDLDTAERLYKMAVERNPKNWIAIRQFAEFCRHERQSIGAALNLYAQAEPYVPKKGPDRALFYREWGMVNRQEGQRDSQQKAVEKFQVALDENPNDRICRFALGQTLHRMDRFSQAIGVLEPIRDNEDQRTRTETRRILLECYENRRELLKAAELRTLVEDD